MTTPNTHNTQQRSFKGDNTRREIIEAAARLFGERGFDATGIRDIEQAAGVSRGAVTYHLGNKEDVWKAAFKHTFFPFLDQMRSNADFMRALEPSARFRHFVGQFVRASARSPQMVRLMIQEGVGGTWRFQFIVESFFAPIADVWRDLWKGSPFLELFQVNPHMRYALLGACNLIFAVPAEIDAMFAQDVYDDAFIDSHIDAVVAIFESFGATQVNKTEAD